MSRQKATRKRKISPKRLLTYECRPTIYESEGRDANRKTGNAKGSQLEAIETIIHQTRLLTGRESLALIPNDR